ncbi:MAG: hypothetical protein WC796_00200 [Candidatus Pacearchaeota archaeon]|jgi:hypothetical protein
MTDPLDKIIYTDERAYEEDKASCEEFKRLMGNSEYDEGYAIFLRNPNLVRFIELGNLMTYYQELRENISRGEAKEFQTQIRREVDQFDELSNAVTFLRGFAKRRIAGN